MWNKAICIFRHQNNYNYKKIRPFLKKQKIIYKNNKQKNKLSQIEKI